MTTESADGSLIIPLRPPNEVCHVTIHEKFRGRATSDRWLPEGLSPGLDGLGAEHLQVRSQVQAALESLAVLDAGYLEEDQAHAQELRQAQREGRADDVADTRTPPDARQTHRAAVEDRLWAGVIVLGEVVDQVFEHILETAPTMLDELRGRLGSATEKKREAEKLLDEARTEEWHVAQQARWVRQHIGDRSFGAQPTPEPSLPPAQFSEAQLERALKIPWHQRGDQEQELRSWQGSATGAGDATGILEPLDPEVAGVET